jgi:hypothetical protein
MAHALTANAVSHSLAYRLLIGVLQDFFPEPGSSLIAKAVSECRASSASRRQARHRRQSMPADAPPRPAGPIGGSVWSDTP